MTHLESPLSFRKVKATCVFSVVGVWESSPRVRHARPIKSLLAISWKQHEKIAQRNKKEAKSSYSYQYVSKRKISGMISNVERHRNRAYTEKQTLGCCRMNKGNIVWERLRILVSYRNAIRRLPQSGWHSLQAKMVLFRSSLQGLCRTSSSSSLSSKAVFQKAVERCGILLRKDLVVIWLLLLSYTSDLTIYMLLLKGHNDWLLLLLSWRYYSPSGLNCFVLLLLPVSFLPSPPMN